MNFTKKTVVVLGLICFSLVFSACSTMAIPSIVLRRWNDVGVVYYTTPSQAEAAVTNAIAEMGCSIRYVTRAPLESNGSYFSQAGSMTINGLCPQNDEMNRHFVVDIDRVPGHADWCKIRIGIGDFGKNDMAVEFHKILMRTLSYVPEKMPESNKEKLLGISSASESSSSTAVLREGYIIEPASSK